MSKGVTCAPEGATLVDAARRLAALDIGAMPICGEDDRLKGVITDRDIVVKAVARGRDAATTLVRELAEGKPVTIGADDSAEEAVRVMERHQIRRLPVIDRQRLVGIISQADVARHLREKTAGHLVSRLSEGRGASSSGWLRRGAPFLIALPLLGLVVYAGRRRASGRAGKVEATAFVNVPARAAYDQWTQFEEFPAFMDGVDEVRQLDDTHLRWRATVAGQPAEWEAEITEQEPDRVVAWRAIEGRQNAGRVMFRPLDAERTEIKVVVDYEPSGLREGIGSALGLDARRVSADLERFRELIERRGAPSGGWRGEVHEGDVRP
jgi:uncharacterized membrane protein/predicted transcriptional regulator